MDNSVALLCFIFLYQVTKMENPILVTNSTGWILNVHALLGVQNPKIVLEYSVSIKVCTLGCVVEIQAPHVSC